MLINFKFYYGTTRLIAYYVLKVTLQFVENPDFEATNEECNLPPPPPHLYLFIFMFYGLY